MHECLLMDQQPFYRTGLDGQKIPVSFSELHPILRDVVHYFEINLNERQNVLILAEYSKLEYWKYLSISWTSPEVAESKRYTWLCERGCLGLLNGLSLDFLTVQQVVGSEQWRHAKALARESLPYLRSFQPTDAGLEEGRDFLIDSFTFITELSQKDLDDDGTPMFATQAQSAWFTRSVVGDYFRSTAELDFG
jgi:hypothetical protein